MLSYEKEFYFQWHITDLCNLRCKHCYHSDYSQKGLALPYLMDIASHLCEAIKEWGKTGSFSITGGEPFVRKDEVFKLLDFFESQDNLDHVDILTNGTLIDDSIIQNLQKYKKLRRIQLSLEGLKKTNDMIRGNGSYELIFSKLKQIIKGGLTACVMMTIGKHNKDEVIPLVKTLGEIGVEAFALDRFIPEGQSDNLKEWVLDSSELKDVYEKSYEYFQNSLSPRMLLYRTLFCLLNPEDEHIGAMCSVGNNALTIMPNDDVYPCRRLPIKLGNLLETTVYDIWYTHPLLKEFRNPDNLKGKCKDCGYVQACRG